MTRIANARNLRSDLRRKRWNQQASAANELYDFGTSRNENNVATILPRKPQIHWLEKGKINSIRSIIHGWYMAVGYRFKIVNGVFKCSAKNFRDNIIVWRWPDWVLLGCSVYFGTGVWLWVLG